VTDRDDGEIERPHRFKRLGDDLLVHAGEMKAAHYGIETNITPCGECY